MKSKLALLLLAASLLLCGCEDSSLHTLDASGSSASGNIIAAAEMDTSQPTAKPTATPIPQPTATPTPTAAPTPEPTATPTPTAAPTPKPTATPAPTTAPTPEPTIAPTPQPTEAPTPQPAAVEENSSSGQTEGTAGSGGDSNYNTYNNTEQQQTTATYVLNTSSHKIHHPSCSSVPKIAPHNYATSNESLDTLKSQGYTTCGRCF